MTAISAENYFFANKGEVTIAGSDATPASVSIYAVKDVEFTDGAEHVPLWAWGSIRRVAVARHSEKAGVKIGYMKINPKAATLIGYILDPSTGTLTYTDSNDVKLFNVNCLMKNESDETATATIHDVYFPSLPIKMTEGQWVKLDLVGEGTYVSWA